MKKIGVTGGIGSGKSVVCEIFRILGCKVYNSDERAKQLLDTDPKLRSKLITTFGENIYTGQKVNRKALAEIVFRDSTSLKKLNDLVHPAVFEDFDQWLKINGKEKYIIKEAAILFESGAYKNLDSIVLVYAPLELRIARVMKRDSVTRESVTARINNQMNDEEKLKMSDYVVQNDENSSLIKQVLDLHNNFSI